MSQTLRAYFSLLFAWRAIWAILFQMLLTIPSPAPNSQFRSLSHSHHSLPYCCERRPVTPADRSLGNDAVHPALATTLAAMLSLHHTSPATSTRPCTTGVIPRRRPCVRGCAIEKNVHSRPHTVVTLNEAVPARCSHDHTS